MILIKPLRFIRSGFFIFRLPAFLLLQSSFYASFQTLVLLISIIAVLSFINVQLMMMIHTKSNTYNFFIYRCKEIF